MAVWLDEADFGGALDTGAKQMLGALKPVAVPRGTVLFSPGERPRGFVIVLEGRIDVHLVGRSGRELLLYSVVRGESCVQTTLGLLGEAAYSAEAIAESDLRAVIIPVELFGRLMAVSEPFRTFVFRAFADRVADVMGVVEQVAFVRVEQRLIAALFERADKDNAIAATHQELAVAIGSAREVVTRQLRAFAARGWLRIERGRIVILDRAALRMVIASGE